LDGARVECQGTLEQGYDLLHVRWTSRKSGAPSENVFERVGPLCRAGGFGTDQLPAERVGDAARNLVLYGEQIADIVVETLRPKMPVGCCIDQLRVDPNLVAGTSDAALEDIPYPQFAADLFGVHVLVFVREGRIARDD